MKCPLISKVAIITDDAELAARLSCVWNKFGYYLPVLDGPRMKRPDGPDEAVRRNNAIARANIKKVALVDLSSEQEQAMTKILPSNCIQTINATTLSATITYLEKKLKKVSTRSTLAWGKSNIGIGLLKAMRNNQLLEINNDGKVETAELNEKKHLVVCEAGKPLSEIIAANYAYSLDADFIIIPEVNRDIAERITEDLYSIDEQQDQSFTDNFIQISGIIKQLCPNVVPLKNENITFFTSHIPYGLAFPEVPSTHLNIYPDLGVTVLNGFASGNSKSTGVRSAVLVDPGESQALEIKPIIETLVKHKIFVRGYPSERANVRDITNTVQFFPYDFLYFATHCGDVEGYRDTYEFKDASGKNRRLVVDTAVSFDLTGNHDKVKIVEFRRFHELDGISWSDPDKSKKMVVGTAINDFDKLVEEKKLEPAHREKISRVLGSSVLEMYDDNYIPMLRQLAGNGTPVIFNNSCSSWHELSNRFMFAGSRAYIGTLFPVHGFEAAPVAEFFVEHQEDTTLAESLWRSQNETYGSQSRRPYIIMGVYPQNLRVFVDNTPSYIQKQMENQLKHWEKEAIRDNSNKKAIEEVVRYYQNEILHFKKTSDHFRKFKN